MSGLLTLNNTPALNSTLHPPFNVTNTMENTTAKLFSVFDGCETMVAAILFDLSVQAINTFLGIPANILVMVIIYQNRREPSTSDMFIFLLAFLDGYFGVMVPISFLNLYYWNSVEAWMAIKFAYGVKDTSGPLFLSCICLDRFMAVLFPITFSRLKAPKYRAMCSAVVLLLTVAYASAKTIGGIPHFEKIFTGEILTVFTFMVMCNLAILWALQRSRAGRDDMHPMKKKAFKMVLSILAIIIFNYLPPVALFPFQEHYAADVFRCYVQPVGFAFVNISSSMQPLIYLSRLEKVPFISDACMQRCSHKKAHAAAAVA